MLLNQEGRRRKSFTFNMATNMHKTCCWACQNSDKAVTRNPDVTDAFGAIVGLELGLSRRHVPGDARAVVAAHRVGAVSLLPADISHILALVVIYGGGKTHTSGLEELGKGIGFVFETNCRGINWRDHRCPERSLSGTESIKNKSSQILFWRIQRSWKHTLLFDPIRCRCRLF